MNHAGLRTVLAVAVFTFSAALLTCHLLIGTRSDPGRDVLMLRSSTSPSRVLFLRTDFASFYYAAKAVAEDKRLYSAQSLDSLAARDSVANHVLPYLYPPFFAIVAQPIARLSPLMAQRVWDAAQVVGMSLACVLIVLTIPFRSAEIHGGSYWIVGSTIVCVAVVVFPFGENLAFGQINSFVLLLTSASFFLSINTKRDWLAGAALGAATLIKVTPALLLVPFVVNKRWRVLGGFFAGVALLILVTFDIAGKDSWREFLAFLPNMGYARNVQGGFHPSIVANFSLAGFFMRLLPGEGVAIRLLTIIVVFVLLALVLYHHLKKGNERNELPFVLAYLIIMLIASPVTWRHHLILLFPGVVFILRQVWFESAGRRKLMSVAAIAVLTALLVVDFQAIYPFIPMPEELRPLLTSMNLWLLVLLLSLTLALQRNTTQEAQ